LVRSTSCYFRIKKSTYLDYSVLVKSDADLNIEEYYQRLLDTALGSSLYGFYFEMVCLEPVSKKTGSETGFSAQNQDRSQILDSKAELGLKRVNRTCDIFKTGQDACPAYKPY
jgi:hypothetical protein